MNIPYHAGNIWWLIRIPEYVLLFIWKDMIGVALFICPIIWSLMRLSHIKVCMWMPIITRGSVKQWLILLMLVNQRDKIGVTPHNLLFVSWYRGLQVCLYQFTLSIRNAVGRLFSPIQSYLLVSSIRATILLSWGNGGMSEGLATLVNSSASEKYEYCML